jgi:hypothetical protein
MRIAAFWKDFFKRVDPGLIYYGSDRNSAWRTREAHNIGRRLTTFVAVITRLNYVT